MKGFDANAVGSSAGASGACSRPNVHARTVHVVQPDYPALVVMTRTSGLVQVFVALSETGAVRSARLSNDTLGDRPGSEEVVEAAVLAAATTTYAPKIRDCVAVPGSYAFRSDFTN
jgi:hypothetical protein